MWASFAKEDLEPEQVPVKKKNKVKEEQEGGANGSEAPSPRPDIAIGVSQSRLSISKSLKEVKKAQQEAHKVLARTGFVSEADDNMFMQSAGTVPKKSVAKTHHYCLGRIHVVFESHAQNVFLEFAIGEISRHQQSSKPSTRKVVRKERDDDGNIQEKLVALPSFGEDIWVIKPPAAVLFTRVASGKGKEKVRYPGIWEGKWVGTEEELDFAIVRVRVWKLKQFAPNELMGEDEISLKSIASGSVKRECVIFPPQVHQLGQRNHNVPKVAKVSFSLDFHERAEIALDFYDWHLSDDDPNQTTGCSSAYSLDLEVSSTRAGLFGRIKQRFFSLLLCKPYNRTKFGLLPKNNTSTGVCHTYVTGPKHRILFWGSYSWLQEETLTMSLSQRLCCFTFPIAYRSVHLRSILEYGAVNHSLEDHLGRTKAHLKVNGLVECRHNLRMLQEDAHFPTGGLFFRSRDSYLFVKVVSAHDLVGSRPALDSRVTVEWDRVIRETPTCKGTSHPVWECPVFFRIQDDADGPRYDFARFPPRTRDSTLTFRVWEHQGLSRTLLGSCTLPFRRLFFERQQCREFIEEYGVDFAFVGLERLTGEVNERASQQKASQINFPSIKFFVFFWRPDGDIIPDKLLDSTSEPPKPLKEIAHEGLPSFVVGQSSLGPAFLPRFIQKILPPRDVMALPELMYFVFSMEVVPQPEESIRWMWSDPYSILSRRRGDVKDHCVLLTSMLLGCDIPNFSAFVCIGTVTSGPRQNPQPHCWVLTQELYPSARLAVVRFWETLTGVTYALGPLGKQKHRFTKLSDGQAQPQNADVGFIMGLFVFLLGEGPRAASELMAPETFNSEVPYCSLDLVFNDRYVFVNRQRASPIDMTYDFWCDKEWQKFEASGSPRNGPGLEPGRWLPSEALAAEDDIFSHVVHAWDSQRSVVLQTHTRWLLSFDELGRQGVSTAAFTNKLHSESKTLTAREYIRQFLHVWSAYHLRDRGLRSLYAAPDLHQENLYRTWGVRKLVREANKQFKDVLFHFKHADPRRICHDIVTGVEGQRLFSIPAELSPQYAVGVHLTSLPCHLSSVRVYLCAVHNAS